MSDDKAALFKDITFAPMTPKLLFTSRRILCAPLWEQGWRRDVQPEESAQ